MRQKGWNNMAKIYTTMTELIGRTPLLEVKKIEENLGLQTRILVKLEYFNPAGSVKDRAALQMITEAEENGTLKQGSAIIEPTSGKYRESGLHRLQRQEDTEQSL